MKKRIAALASIFSGKELPSVIAHVTGDVQGAWITAYKCVDTGKEMVLTSSANPLSPITGGKVELAKTARNSKMPKEAILKLKIIANLKDGTTLRTLPEFAEALDGEVIYSPISGEKVKIDLDSVEDDMEIDNEFDFLNETMDDTMFSMDDEDEEDEEEIELDDEDEEDEDEDDEEEEEEVELDDEDEDEEEKPAMDGKEKPAMDDYEDEEDDDEEEEIELDDEDEEDEIELDDEDEEDEEDDDEDEEDDDDEEEEEEEEIELEDEEDEEDEISDEELEAYFNDPEENLTQDDDEDDDDEEIESFFDDFDIEEDEDVDISFEDGEVIENVVAHTTDLSTITVETIRGKHWVIAGHTPIGMVDPETCGSLQKKMLNSGSFEKAFASAIKTNGLTDEIITNFGLNLFKQEVEISSLVKRKIDEGVSKGLSEITASHKDISGRYKKTLTLALAGINKGAFSDVKSHPLKDALIQELSNSGVRNPTRLINTAFNNGGNAFLKGVLAKANQLMNEDDTYLESTARFIKGVKTAEYDGENSEEVSEFIQDLSSGNKIVAADDNVETASSKSRDNLSAIRKAFGRN